MHDLSAKKMTDESGVTSAYKHVWFCSNSVMLNSLNVGKQENMKVQVAGRETQH